MKIFSGIQPSGILHIGNYLGAIKQWVELQDEADETIFCIVDLHAITVPQDPERLRENIINTAAIYLASGIDPKKSKIFVQSARPEHAELMWYLNTIAKMGELNRMTQFKDKSGDDVDIVSAGLFNYPVLMAADILLYGATHVPVGDDQKQHIELTRDLAERFNSTYGETFVVPKPIIKKESARIMGLDNPSNKMSKSAPSKYNYIALNDSADEIKAKVMRAVTDSGSEIKASAEKPAISNLLNIFSAVSGKTVKEIEKDFEGKGYGDFKSSLADVVISYLEPIQRRYVELIKDKCEIMDILSSGAFALKDDAKSMVSEVKKKMGIGA